MKTKTKFSFLQSYKPQMKNSSRTQLPSIKIKLNLTKQSNLRKIIIPFMFTEAQLFRSTFIILYLEKLKKARNIRSDKILLMS